VFCVVFVFYMDIVRHPGKYVWNIVQLSKTKDRIVSQPAIEIMKQKIE